MAEMEEGLPKEIDKQAVSEESHLSETQKKRVLEFRRRAEQAYNKQNFGWASELFWEIYILDRKHHVEYLQKMILSSIAAKNLAPNPALYIFKQILSHLGDYFKAFKARDSKEKLEEYFEAHETILKFNPESSFAVPRLAKAYESSGLEENSALILEAFLKSKGKPDLKLLEKMGNLFLKVENYEKARGAFKRILSAKPFDQNAEKKLKDILAMTSIDENKLRGTSFQDKVRDRDASHRAQVEMKVNKSREELQFLIDEKKKEIAAKPDNISLRQDLIRYYREMGDKDSALKTLEELSEIASSDLTILEEKMKAEVEILEEKNKDLEEDELKVLVNRHKKEGMQKLVDMFPSSVELKYRLAVILFELEDNEESLKLFQVSSGTAELAGSSSYYKGVILYRKKMYDLAVDEFQKGTLLDKDMTDMKKEMIYYLGLTYEASGQKEKALEQYKLIYKDDVAFRDVAQKIEDAYK